jgi:iron complex transport system ATP-binding protein
MDNVSFTYDSHEALSNISLQVRKGEFIGIIGPNGAGKSTLLGVMSRILKPKDGTVLIEDANLQMMSQRELAMKVGVVAQDNPVPFRYTVLDIVLMGEESIPGQVQRGVGR